MTPGREADAELLLEALARGLTDEAACRELGWSRRKLRRVLSAALADGGALSRFQLGFLFGRRVAGPERDEMPPAAGEEAAAGRRTTQAGQPWRTR